MEVAIESGLNCIIHQRDAFDDTLAQTQTVHRQGRAAFSIASAKTRTDAPGLGNRLACQFYRHRHLQERGRTSATPWPPRRSDQFMLETDCPYLAPVPYRGKRCEPAYVKEISEAVAQVKGCSLDELSAATCKTAADFFRKL